MNDPQLSKTSRSREVKEKLVNELTLHYSSHNVFSQFNTQTGFKCQWFSKSRENKLKVILKNTEAIRTIITSRGEG